MDRVPFYRAWIAWPLLALAVALFSVASLLPLLLSTVPLALLGIRWAASRLRPMSRAFWRVTKRGAVEVRPHA